MGCCATRAKLDCEFVDCCLITNQSRFQDHAIFCKGCGKVHGSGGFHGAGDGMFGGGDGSGRDLEMLPTEAILGEKSVPTY